MKYYKILSSDLTHHGFKYQEGLNIDTNPFDEMPDCGGGLFFSDAEHILSFVGYGNLIAEVEVPDGTKIVQVEDKYKAHAIVLKNIRPIWTVDTFKYFIEENINIHVKNDNAFRYASETRNLELVKFLLHNGANIHINNDWPLICAALNGHLEVVKCLIDNGADIHADDDDALKYAARDGHLEVVKCLIDNGADIHADDDDALRYAVLNGHLEVVKCLIDNGADIHIDNDYAFKYGTPEVVAYLNSLNK